MKAAWIALVCTSAACVDSTLVECGELVCPPSKVCAPDRSRCLNVEQVTGCAGRAENDACEYLGLSGNCRAGVCEAAGSEPYTVHVSTPGSGAGRIVSVPPGIDCGATCSAMFSPGTQVVLTATPVAGSTFTGWNGPCSGIGTCAITVTAETTVSALFIPPAAPTITSVTPAGGTGAGGDVVIFGTNFIAATSVTFSGTNQPFFTVVSSTSIQTKVPAGVRSGSITVTTPGGMATWSAFTVILADIDTVTGLDTAVAGCVDVGFLVEQADGLPVNVRVDVDPGTGTFQSATPLAGSDSLLGVAASPQGTAYTFHWNSTRDVPHATVSNVVFRVSATVADVAGSAGRPQMKTITVRNGADFAPAVHHGTNSDFGVWAVGDVNGDGRPDVVLRGEVSFDVEIMLGDGHGGFQPSIDLQVPDNVGDVTIADVNGDGKPDLLVGGDFDLWVALGNGDGTFATPRAAGIMATSAVVADLNHDGKPDLICHSGISGSSFTAFGNGDGTFVLADTFLLSGYPVMKGDLNGDGSVDFVDSWTGISAWLGSSNGRFASPVTTPLDGTLVLAALVDLDGDGKLDVVGDAGDHGAIRLGKGDGTFGPEAPFLTWSAPPSLAVGDVNLDGKPDIVVAAVAPRPAIVVVGPDGKSQGTFLLPSALQPPLALAIADLDGDGRPDLLVRHNLGIEVLMNQTLRSCEPAFVEINPAHAAYGPRAIAVADLNGDGRLDLAVGCSDPGSLSILLGNGDGTFQPATQVPATSLPYDQSSGDMTIVAGDLDRDGKIDLVVSSTDTAPNSQRGGSVAVLYGRGDGTFTAPVDYQPFDRPAKVSIGDLDGDGWIDLVASSFSFAAVSLGSGGRSFQPFADLGEEFGTATTGDINGDGKADVVLSKSQGTLSVYLGTHDGLAEPVSAAIGGNDEVTAIADVTGDGYPDVVLLRSDPLTQSIVVMVGNRDGSLGPQIVTPAGSYWIQNKAVVGDFDHDGRADLAVIAVNGFPEIFYGTGGGAFASPVLHLSFSPTPETIAAGDLDGDGRPDLIIADTNSNELSILLSR